MSQVAARSDGAILVSTADLTDRDLTGREVERYVTLTEVEASVLRGRLTNALGEAAACFAVTLPTFGGREHIRECVPPLPLTHVTISYKPNLAECVCS